MDIEELMCNLCKRVYSNSDDLIPRLLPECGHTICTRCLNELLAKEPDQPFVCPEDNVECTRKSCAENYPRNFALIKLAAKHDALKAEESKKKEADEIEALERQIKEAEEKKA